MTHAPDPDRTAWAEFSVWQDTLPRTQVGPVQVHRYVFPDPATSLPDGWTHHARLAEYVEGQDVHLVRRGVGPWILLTHTLATRHVEMFDVSSTLSGLYEQMRDLRAELIRDRVLVSSVARMVTWLGDELSSRYDPNVEAEAAAQVILALGGPAVAEPQSIQGLSPHPT